MSQRKRQSNRMGAPYPIKRTFGKSVRDLSGWRGPSALALSFTGANQ